MSKICKTANTTLHNIEILSIIIIKWLSLIIQYGSNVDHGLGFNFMHKNITQNQSHISFTTVWQY